MQTTSEIIVGDCRESMAAMPERSVQCVVTSPPYWNLRDYCVEGQLGLEATMDEYLAGMVDVFRAVWRILRDDGVMFLNLGDSYCSGLTVFPQSYKMRDDLSEQEKRDVAMAMFGMRFDGHETQSQGAVPPLLSQEVHQESDGGEPAVSVGRIESVLPKTQTSTSRRRARAASAIEVDGNKEAGQQMRLLRGNGDGVYDGGPHSRRRRNSSSQPDRQQQRKQHQDIQGHSESGISERQVSSAVLQLQLLDRLLGVLSTHTFPKDEISDSVRFAFTEVAPLKPKDLIGMPWRLAFALQADGWYLRSDIIWQKPNPMPESVTDRPTKSHEHMFLLTKRGRYFYDAIAVREDGPTYTRKAGGYNSHHEQGASRFGGTGGFSDSDVTTVGRNLRDVWTIPTEAYAEAHFATFPRRLVEPCIKAGTSDKGCCPECGAPWRRVVERTRSFESGSGRSGNMPSGKNGPLMQGGGETLDVRRGPTVSVTTLGWEHGCECCDPTQVCLLGGDPDDYKFIRDPVPCVVLDPFAGSGTTGVVAKQLGRSFIGCELNPEYSEMARRRIANPERVPEVVDIPGQMEMFDD